MKLTYSPVKEYAIKNNIKVYQPEKIKNNVEFKNLLEEINPDFLCSCLWKDYTKRYFGNTKVWVCKCTWVFITKI